MKYVITALFVSLFAIPALSMVGCSGRESTTVIEQPQKTEAEIQKEQEDYEKSMSSDS